jgi:O-antigen ligase
MSTTLLERALKLPPELRRETSNLLPAQRAERWTTISLAAAFVFQPILHPTGPANSSPVDILIIISIVCFAIWVRRQPRKLRAPYFIPVGLMVAAGAASGITGQFPNTALQALFVDILLFAWCTTIVNSLNKPRTLQLMLMAWALSGIGWAVIVTLAWAGHITPLEGLQAAEGNRVLFTFGDPNYASTYWLTTIFVVYAIQCPRRRWLRFVGYAFLLWALILTESNGGFLGLGLGIALIILVKAHKKWGWAGLIATLLTIGLSVGAFFTVVPLNSIRQKALYSNQPLLVNSIGRSAQSSSERTELISELGHLYGETNGLLGIGPGATKPTLTNQLADYPNEAHNDFLAALIERGPLGLVGLILLVGSAVLWAGPLVRKRLSNRFAAAVPIPIGLAAGLLALSVNSFYEEILHFRFLWALLAIVAVLGIDSKRGSRSEISGQSA